MVPAVVKRATAVGVTKQLRRPASSNGLQRPSRNHRKTQTQETSFRKPLLGLGLCLVCSTLKLELWVAVESLPGRRSQVRYRSSYRNLAP